SVARAPREHGYPDDGVCDAVCSSSVLAGSVRSALSHSASDALSSSFLCEARRMKSSVIPSQCVGSPYLPFTGMRGDRFSKSATSAALFRVLHLLHDVTK